MVPVEVLTPEQVAQAYARYEQKGISKVRKLVQSERPNVATNDHEAAINNELFILSTKAQELGLLLPYHTKYISYGKHMLGTGLRQLWDTLDQHTVDVFSYQMLRVTDDAPDFGEFYYRVEMMQALRARAANQITAFEPYGTASMWSSFDGNYYGIPDGIQITPRGDITMYDFYTADKDLAQTDTKKRADFLRKTLSTGEGQYELSELIRSRRRSEVMRKVRYDKQFEVYSPDFNFKDAGLVAVCLQSGDVAHKKLRRDSGYDRIKLGNVTTVQAHGFTVRTIRELGR